jgi:hypothetical protein
MSARMALTMRAMAATLVVLLFAGVFGGVMGAGSARGDTAPLDPAQPATPTTAAADALPTVQINGVAWSQAIVGNTVYVGGKFTTARPAGAPAGTQETPRNNLLAYDIRTGQLITSFAPDLNGQVLAVAASPDGSRIYVGGDFTQVDGQPRSRIAAYSTATGALVPDFRPSVSGQVYTIAATNSVVYVGGYLYGVGSQTRNRLAAFTPTGGLLPWAPVPGEGPTANGGGGSNAIKAIVVTGNGSQVVVAGHFGTLNGVKATGVGALDAVTGETRPFAANKFISNQGVNSAIYSLSTDSTNVYGTGYDYYGPGNLEGSFAATADGGALLWVNDCQGDTYSSVPMNGALYMAGHPHHCGNIGAFPEENPRINKFATAVSLVPTTTVGNGTLDNNPLTRGKPAPSLLPWFPTVAVGTITGQNQAGWNIAGNGRYLAFAGEFPRVNGTGQQGLVRFAMPDIAPNKVGPDASTFSPTVSSPIAGMARVRWTATSDQDNENLTYRVYRDGDLSTPVYETVRASTFWNRPAMGFNDTVAEGSHTYRVTVSDPFGNQVASPWMTVTVAAGSVAQRAYADAVRADGADKHWPLGEASGNTAYDFAGVSDLSVRAGRNGATPNRGADGAITGDRDTAYQFRGMSGTSNLGFLSTQTAVGGSRHLHRRGVVQDHFHGRWEDPRLRQLGHGQQQQLRPARLHEHRRAGAVRCLPGRRARRLEHRVLQRRRVAPRRRLAEQRRHGPVRRRPGGRIAHRHHVGPGLPRVLAGRR